MPLHAYLPQDRRRALARGAPLPGRCSGAALFADLCGFTALTEQLAQGSGQRRGVDELARRINAVHAALIAEVERCGGSVVALAGDGLACWFDDADGAPGALRAARCARGMQRAMQRSPGLAVRVGVSAGAARRRAVGDPAIQLVDLLYGATVARAVTAQGLAEAGEVVVDAAVAARLAPQQLGPRRGEDFRRHDFAAAAAVAEPAADAAKATAIDDEAVDATALQRWVLPFVAERERAGGLFATELRPATALFLRLAAGAGEVGDDEDGDDEGAALDAALVLAQRVLQLHGGVLLETTVDAAGCCLYGSFGAAQVHEDDAGRALRAALALRQRFAADGHAVAIGVASGTLCVGGYGGPTRRSFGAIGDEVNTAARLMALARPGEILLGGRALQLAGSDAFAFEARPALAMKGKAEPLPVFALASLRERRAIRLQEPAALLPLVGRDAETAVLAQQLAAARAGRGGMLRIVGEAGLGKSRLVAEGIRLARREGFIGYGGAGRPGGVRTPYLVWHGVWSALFDIDPALPQRRQRAAVQALLREHAAEHAEAWPLLGAVLGQDWPDTPFTAALEPRDRKALLEAMLLRCLRAAAQEAADDGLGVLLVLEDLHAADPPSLDLLAAIVRGIGSLPVLVLATERCGDGAAAGDPLAARPLPPALLTTIELAALGAGDIAQIVRAKLALQYPERSGAVPRELFERIAARAQGNPFYAEQLLDDLHDRGLDPRHPEAAAALAVPSSLHSLVLARIHRLPLAEQSVLKAASVIGRVFTPAELHACCPGLGSADEVAARLALLDRLGFTPRLPDAALPSHVFRHLVTLEVSYESIGHDVRARLHEQYARHLERRDADDEPARLPQLAHHFERAGCRAEALHYLRRAAEQAAARFANDEALDGLDRALRCVDADDVPTRFALLVQRQAIHALQGRHREQRADVAELERLAPLAGDAAACRAVAATQRARLETGLGEHAAALASARIALAAVEGLGGPAAEALRIDARLELGDALFAAGEFAAARESLATTLALARRGARPGAAVTALLQAGRLQWHVGELGAAAEAFGEALALAQSAGDLRAQAKALNSLGVVAKSRADFDAAVAHYTEALQIVRRIGDRPGEAMLLNNLGSACLSAGSFHDAGEHCRRAATFFADAGEPVEHAVALANCAEAQRELGRYAQALELSAQALALLRASGARAGEALVLENTGLAELASGRPADAVRSLQAAVAIARDSGSRPREASALVHLGQACAAAGERDAARRALDAGQALASRLGDEGLTLEADAAQALLLLDAGSAAAALQRIEPLLDALAAPVRRLPLVLHAAALRVLHAAADPRAAALHAAARQQLAESAERIPDAAARRDFLAIAEHRLIAGQPEHRA